MTTPWIEKYRPKLLNEIVSHKNIVDSFKKYLHKKSLNNVLLCGSSGTGKTSLINAFAIELYGDYYSMMVLTINASEERGIETVRNKIKNFAMTKGMNKKLFKLIILDEVDAMTVDAQFMLRNVMERYITNVRFCLICNFIKKVNMSLQSYCIVFKFHPLNWKDVYCRIKMICDDNNIKVNDSNLKLIHKISFGDMRKIINMLQIIKMSELSKLTNIKISELFNYPIRIYIDKIFTICNKNNFKLSIIKITKIVDTIGINNYDLIIEITKYLVKKLKNNEIDCLKFHKYMPKLKNVMVNLSTTQNNKIQLIAIISIIKKMI